MALEQPQKPESSSGGGWLLLAVAIVAYRVGKARGARQKTPAPSLSSMVASYAGLRAMDSLFRGFLKG